MSPFVIVVILILTVLFVLLSLTPVLSDMDSVDTSKMPETKAAH
jgi:hypothetical protein